MTTRTTAHLTRGRRQRLRRFLRRHDPWLLIALTLLALPLLSAGLGALVDSFSTSHQPIIIMATPALPTPPRATPTVTSPVVATPALQVASASALCLSRAVIAYSAPSADAAIGAVEPGRVYTPTGRLGADWLLAEVAGSGTVWLRLIDLAGLAGVPDIATPAPPVVPAVLIAAPTLPERDVQPTVAPPPPPPTPAMQLLTAPEPTPWDSEAAQRAERADERRAWQSVDDGMPTVEPQMIIDAQEVRAGRADDVELTVPKCAPGAADLIKASDTFNALAAELNYTGLSLPPDRGGLTAEDFASINSNLTPEQLLGFFTTMQALLKPLTVKQKKVIDATKGSSQNILPPGI